MNGSISPRNTNNFWLIGLKDEADDSYINDAAVTWEVRTENWDSDGTPNGSGVASGSGTYVAGSNGDYRCDVDAAAVLVYATKYYRRVIAVKAGVGTFDAIDSFIAMRRTGKTPTT